MTDHSINHSYAGIGSRNTPDYVLGMMRDIGHFLTLAGWCLHSGAADGADSAFEEGSDFSQRSSIGRKRIMLPWNGFNGRSCDEVGAYCPVTHESPTHKSFLIAQEHHPAWHKCSPAARKLHARNAHIILGLSLKEPVDFVVCWTPNAQITGGTGLALRIAQSFNIPIFNLADDEALDNLEIHIKALLHTGTDS